MNQPYRTLATKAIHSGEPQPKRDGAVVFPIYQTAMYEFDGEGGYNDIPYIRMNNTPNHRVLQEKLAALENAEAALVAASGMAAISAALLTVLKPGDHLLAQDCLYGGTHDFITREFPAFGIEFDFIDASKPDTWKAVLRSNSRAIYVESMTNPLLQVGDLQQAARFAGDHGLVSLIDNTFPSPFNFRPLGIGFDIALHSCTKYLNGHSDLVAGAVISTAEMVEKVTRKLNLLGGCLDPHACFLLHRGIKTLAVRMRQHNENALQIARLLDGHAKVARVNYPGLETHPNHQIARELFDGFSGMLSFELNGGLEAAERFIKNVRLPVCAPSLGGVESLITRPATTSHAGMSDEERQQAGISDALIRVSVGIESAEELMEDFQQALDAC